MSGRRLGRMLRLRRRADGADSSPGETASVGRKKRKKDIWNEAVSGFKEGLSMLHDSADACPPLKSVTGGLAHIVKVLETLKGNEEEAQRIMQRINALLDLLENLVPDCTKISGSLLLAIAGLDTELNNISADVAHIPQRNAVKRYFKASDEIEKLRFLRERFDAAMEHFKISASIRTEIAVEDLKIAFQSLNAQGSFFHPHAHTPLNFDFKAFAFTNLYRGPAFSH